MKPTDADATTLDLERVSKRLRPLGSPVRLRLLRFLAHPHYLEEIASHLKMNRYAAKRHVDELLSINLIRAVPGRRESGPVRDYIIAPEAIFELYDAVRTLGEIRPAHDVFAETLPGLLTRTKAASKPLASHAQSTSFPYLVTVYGAEIGRAFPLAPHGSAEDSWNLGRDSNSDVPIETDPFASNRHARIQRRQSEFTISDAYSTNGTWLNWNRLSPGESAPLRRGAVVGIGKTLLVFQPPSQ